MMGSRTFEGAEREQGEGTSVGDGDGGGSGGVRQAGTGGQEEGAPGLARGERGGRRRKQGRGWARVGGEREGGAVLIETWRRCEKSAEKGTEKEITS